MKLVKEPKEVDLIIKSEPWSEKDLADFRKLMQEIKRKNNLKENESRKSTEKEPTRKAA